MAIELGSGFITLGIKYDDAIRKISGDIGGLETASARTAKNVAANLSGGFKNAATEAGKHGTTAGAAFSEGLIRGINQAFGGVAGNLGKLEGTATKAFEGITSKAGLAAIGVAGVGVAAVGVVSELYKLGRQWDDLGDTITARTGIMGTQLESMKTTIVDVGRQSVISLQAISDISTGVAQSFNLTGAAAQPVIDQLSKLQELTKEAPDTRGLGQAFQLFNVSDTQRQLEIVNQLKAVSDATGVSYNELVSQTLNAGKATKQFGIDMQDTAAIIGSFNEAGLNANQLLPSLSIALKNFAAAGRDPADALRETLAKIKDLGDSPAADKLAQKTFGRGYIDFLNAVKDTDIVDKLNKTDGALNKIDANHIIDREVGSTRDWDASWIKLGHTLEGAVMPAAQSVFGFIGSQLEHAIDQTGQLVDKYLSLGDAFKGPDLQLPNTPPFADFGHPPSKGSIRPPGSSGSNLAPDNPLVPGFRTPLGPGDKWTPGPGQPELEWVPGQGWVPVPTDSTKKSNAPVLPINTALPEGFANLPQNTNILGAEGSFIDARHALEEKQAQLTQLEQSGVAKEGDIQQARNDVYEAQRRQQDSELKLYETRQDMYDKENKRVEDENKKIDEESKKYESRFSGGSLLDFLVWLAFKPVFESIGQANQASSASAAASPFGAAGLPNRLSSGLPSGLPPNLLSGVSPSAAASLAGYPGDAALLANVKPGTYVSEPGVGDLTKGIGDCTSSIEDLVNILDKRPTEGRELSTGNEAQWLQSHGFLPNTTGANVPGAFNVGFNAGHSQATLPGGTNFNWGSNAAAAAGGVSGGGAFDPSQGFTQHFYRPVGAPATPSVPSATPAGLSPQQWNNIMGAEAGGSGGWGANTGNGFSGGLQFKPSTWAQFGGTQYAKEAWQATPQQQMDIGNKVLLGQGPSAWPATFAAHPEWFGLGMQTGGSIPGFGGGDKVPLLAEGGEFVVNKDSARQWLPFLKGINAKGFQEGGSVDPNEILKQLAQQGQMPGGQNLPQSGQLPIGSEGMFSTPGKDQSSPLNVGRTQGYVPAGAGASGQAGSSMFSGAVGLGADVINKLIDEGVSAASSAAGIAGAGASFGAGGGAAAGATSMILGIGADIAKKGVSYAAQVIGILGDSAVEIFSPFGVPRFFNTDPRGFMPQIAGLPAAVTTGEKALLGDRGKPEQQPNAPVQPGQLPGRQPVGAPVTKADPGGVASMPIDIGQIVGGNQGRKFGPGIPGTDATKPGAGAHQQPGPLSGPGSPKPPKQPKPSPTQHGPSIPGGQKPNPNQPSFWSTLGIFDNGGWLMPNQLALNAGKRPEPILSDQQGSYLKALASQPPGKYDSSSAGVSNDYSVRIDSVTVKDVEAMSREISDQQRLQVMRHNGRRLMGANS